MDVVSSINYMHDVIIFSHRSKAAPQMAVSACQSPHWSRTHFINIKGLVMEFGTNTPGGQR